MSMWRNDTDWVRECAFDDARWERVAVIVANLGSREKTWARRAFSFRLAPPDMTAEEVASAALDGFPVND